MLRWRQSTEKISDNGFFDGARGVAACIVLLGHGVAVFLVRLLGPEHVLATSTGFAARQAVLLFFVLSGYLITLSIRANIDRHRAFNVRSYLISRFSRIYPPLIGALILCVAVVGLVHLLQLPGTSSIKFGLPGDLFRIRETIDFKPIELVTALAMYGGMQNIDGPLWTLYIEAQIYVIAFAVAVWWQRNWIWRIVGTLAGVVAFSLVFHWHHFLLIWMLGAMAAFLIPSRSLALLGCAAALLAVAILVAIHPAWGTSEIDYRGGRVVQICLAVIYTAVLFYIPHARPTPKYIAATGQFSYSLYIIHFQILILVYSATQGWTQYSMSRAALAMVSGIVVSVLFAKAFSYVFERKAIFEGGMHKLLNAAPLQKTAHRAPRIAPLP